MTSRTGALSEHCPATEALTAEFPTNANADVEAAIHRAQLTFRAGA